MAEKSQSCPVEAEIGQLLAEISRRERGKRVAGLPRAKRTRKVHGLETTGHRAIGARTLQRIGKDSNKRWYVQIGGVKYSTRMRGSHGLAKARLMAEIMTAWPV